MQRACPNDARAHAAQSGTRHSIAERALRIIALGRRNALFAGSSVHAQNLAMLHSVVATCRLHGANPYEYIADVLIRLQSHPASRVAELMPWRWRPPDRAAP